MSATGRANVVMNVVMEATYHQQIGSAIVSGDCLPSPERMDTSQSGTEYRAQFAAMKVPPT